MTVQSKLHVSSYLKTATVVWLMVLTVSPLFSHLVIPLSMASYNIGVAQDSLTVSITGDFVQGIKNPYVNATGIFALLPNFHGSLQGGNSSQLVTALTKSIRERSPAAVVSQVRLLIDSNGNSNQTRVSYDLTFIVQNVTGSSGSICCKT